MSAEYPVMACCGQYQCTCGKTPEAPKTLADILQWRFVELGEMLGRYCGEGKFEGSKSVSALQAIFAKHKPRGKTAVSEDPASPSMAGLLPEVVVSEPNQICPFNLAKGQIAVLLDTIRLHIPALDFLAASHHLNVVAEILTKSRYEPEYPVCFPV